MAAALCLLFQQLALASYECRGALSAPAGAEAMLCASHCAPDSPVPADLAKLPLPAAVVQSLIAVLPVAGAAVPTPEADADSPGAGSDPPPRLRYCSLLI